MELKELKLVPLLYLVLKNGLHRQDVTVSSTIYPRSIIYRNL